MWLHVEWDLRPSSAAVATCRVGPQTILCSCGVMSELCTVYRYCPNCGRCIVTVGNGHDCRIPTRRSDNRGTRFWNPQTGCAGPQRLVLFRRVLYYRDSVHIYVYMYVGYKCLVMGPVVRQYASQWTCAAETPWW